VSCVNNWVHKNNVQYIHCMYSVVHLKELNICQAVLLLTYLQMGNDNLHFHFLLKIIKFMAVLVAQT